jgi:hypothetical protein
MSDELHNLYPWKDVVAERLMKEFMNNELPINEKIYQLLIIFTWFLGTVATVCWWMNSWIVKLYIYINEKNTNHYYLVPGYGSDSLMSELMICELKWVCKNQNLNNKQHDTNKTWEAVSQ